MLSISIASDHNGVSLRLAIKSYLDSLGYTVQDFGCDSDTDSVDYPDYVDAVVSSVIKNESNYGILICGTGIGMSMAANRHRGIRAALCHNVETVRLAREHNNANILCLGARCIDIETAKKIVQQFLTTEFTQGRHSKRVDKLD